MADTDTGAETAADTTIDTGAADTGAPEPQDTQSGLAAAWDKLSAELPTTGQPRAPDGKFAPKPSADAAPQVEGAPATTAQPAAQPGQAAAPAAGADAKPADGADLPQYWTPEDKAMALKALPEVREWMVNRDRMLERAWTAKTQELAAAAKPYDAFHQTLGPYMTNARNRGYDLVKAAEGLFATEDQLTRGSPEQKLAIVKNIVDQYHIDISGLAAQAAETAPFVDPTLQPLQAELAELKAWRQQQEQGVAQQRAAAQQADQQRIEREIANFKDERGADGQLLRPHMAAVLNEMIGLLNVPGTSLQTAYDNAIYANPTLRAQEIARQRQADEDQRMAEAKAAAAKAQTTRGFQAARPAGAPAPQPAAKPGLSSLESLSATWDRLAEAS